MDGPTALSTRRAGNRAEPRPAGVSGLEPRVELPPSAGNRRPACLSPGLFYAIAAAPGPGVLERARALASHLRASAAGELAEERELPGILWGFRRGEMGDGNRLSTAAAGRLEAVLWGDPVWLEPWTGRPCNAEELLRAWESEGPRAALRLDNLFLAAVADRESGELVLTTDRTGGIRLYTFDAGGVKAFTTSYLAASRLAPAKTIDAPAIATFFHLGYFPGRRTALRDVAVHPFASRTRLKAGGAVEVEPCWQPDLHVDRSRSLAGVLDEAVTAFNATVREYTAGFAGARLAMTAGLDSRTVASSLLRQEIPFTTYTHGFPGSWEEKRVRKIVARHGIPHRFVPLADGFTSRLGELALESFRLTEGEISSIEKSHLLHVLANLKEEAPAAALLLGGGAGMLKGTYYRLLRDEEPYTAAGVSSYLAWNLEKRLPDVFAPDVPARDPGVLRDFVTAALDEAGGGSFFQRLDYFYLTRYRRWAAGVKGIYRRFFPVREPFVSARLLDYLFPVDPPVKNAHLPHYEILARNFPALQFDLTNKMTPALPLNARTFHRFLPSAWWRAKQVLRGFTRRYLPFELFPLVDYVDYRTWIAGPSGRALLDEILDPPRMASAFLYRGSAFAEWLARQKSTGFAAFPLLDRMATLELYFREVGGP